ncbi:Ferric hydroxamate ABC transporter, periplasmic substrate binding protein FhuD [Caenispirillum salinarum AK4]|uniref:Ferric hydroxamate ABC transporter, periplasmic substrate binding protein FhuD n=2 Tax=Caenispirillum TaxID=414051 RepID=K9HEM8_9PROT|nr:Ferric hydroxamate ABC transporter, periplasmic substrate binding protein FhuD [Caenispirillum salinarum AK4]
MLALGVEPVGVASADAWDRWVKTPELPPGTIDLGQDLAVNLELLAFLEPDLIVISPYVAAARPALERIAPVEMVTIYAPDGPSPLERAVAETRRLGALLGRTGAADAYLDATFAELADMRARLSRLPLPAVALVSFMLDARHARIYGRHSLYQDVLDRLGVENAWTGATNFWGFQTIGLERMASMADAAVELIVFEPIADEMRPTLEKSPLWLSLPFVRREDFVMFPPVLMFGMVPSAIRFARLLTEHLEARFS